MWLGFWAQGFGAWAWSFIIFVARFSFLEFGRWRARALGFGHGRVWGSCLQRSRSGQRACDHQAQAGEADVTGAAADAAGADDALELKGT